MAIYFAIGIGTASFVEAAEQINTNDLLVRVGENLKSSPEKTIDDLAKLASIELTFDQTQREKYYILKAASLSIRGQFRDEVELMESLLKHEQNSDLRAWYLYYLTDAYANLGQYDNALISMNKAVILLPKIAEKNTKIVTLQAAVTLLNSLRAYEDSIGYANRIYEIDINNTYAKCIGMSNKIEINFLSGNRRLAHSFLPDAIKLCDAYGSKFITLIVKSLAAIDLIDSDVNSRNLSSGLSLLLELSKTNQTSDYVTQLEEAIARAYLKNSDLQLAERYGVQAYQHAQNSKVLQMMEKTSETMAKIKRAQGNMASALDFYDINLALKKKVLDDQLHKNLAYQRVKFDTQDKANQLTLLEQKNKILSTEKQLEQKNNQNLLMLIALGAILMAVLAAWSFKTLKQKNLFRLSSQIDGLTQVSNRSHFVACGMQQFDKSADSISVILFDMDHFKNINDSFGHSVGDWVLKTVSDKVKALLPKAEMLGRLGGEEFAICLPKFDQHQALALAESCRAAIAAIDSLPSGFAFPITASFGVASRGMRELKEFEDTLAAADKALYFSKTEGRNRVSLYQ